MNRTRIAAVSLSTLLALSVGLGDCAAAERTSKQPSPAGREPETSGGTHDPLTWDMDTILYWEGGTDRGMTFTYSENEETGNTSVLITTNSFEEALFIDGPLTADGNRLTITSDRTKDRYSFVLLSASDDGSLTIDAGEYGTAILVPITARHFRDDLEEATAELTPLLTEIGHETIDGSR